MIKQITTQELREIYKNNINAPCKKYGKDVNHYCFVPILLKTKKGNYLTINWFVNGNDELIFKPCKNLYLNLTLFDKGNENSGLLEIYLINVSVKNISGRII